MMITTVVKVWIVNNSNAIIRVLLLLCSVSIFFFMTGCAASSATVVEEEVVTNPKPMYSYTSLVIKDFELKRELYSDAADASMSRSDLRYEKLPKELSDHIERYVRSHRTYKNISRDGKADASTLLLTGKFIRLGRFKISVAVSLRDGASNQEVAFFRETLWDVLDTTDSFSSLGREIADFINRIQYK